MKRTLLLLVIGFAFVATACGNDTNPTGSDAAATRTIQITMRDIAFEPTSLQVDAGETVRFVFTNEGRVDHDAFIGDAAAQAEHETEMRSSGDAHAGHGGGEEGSITVAAGDTGELTHTFEKAGEIQIGCHEPGHYEAGMKIDVTVT